MSSKHDDTRLVRSLLKGDEAAYVEFFEGYFSRLYRFALTRVADELDAEEVVQSSLIRALRKLDSFRGEAALFTWLCTICRREIADLARRRGRRPQELDLVEGNPEVRAALESLPAALVGEPESRYRRKEVAHLVQLTLDHLPRHYGNALEWKYIEGLSVREIGDLLEIGPKAAESLLTRAREAFRTDFVALGGDLLKPGLVGAET